MIFDWNKSCKYSIENSCTLPPASPSATLLSDRAVVRTKNNYIGEILLTELLILFAFHQFSTSDLSLSQDPTSQVSQLLSPLWFAMLPQSFLVFGGLDTLGTTGQWFCRISLYLACLFSHEQRWRLCTSNQNTKKKCPCPSQDISMWDSWRDRVSHHRWYSL